MIKKIWHGGVYLFFIVLQFFFIVLQDFDFWTEVIILLSYNYIITYCHTDKRYFRNGSIIFDDTTQICIWYLSAWLEWS